MEARRLAPRAKQLPGKAPRPCFEYPVPPERRFLRWCVEHPNKLKWSEGVTFGAETTRMRRAVAEPDAPTAVALAVTHLERAQPRALAGRQEVAPLQVRQDPAAVLGCAVAVGQVVGPAAGLLETDRLREVLGDRQRWHAVRGHLHELDGDLPASATAYVEAARRVTNVAERDHQVRQAARARAAEL